jgi:hypothetical protein
VDELTGARGFHVAVIAVVIGVCSALAPAARGGNVPHKAFVVQPIYVFPSDQAFHQEYADAVRAFTREVRAWYADQVGKAFRLAKLRVVRADQDYLTLRCGADPADWCRFDRQQLPFFWSGVFNTIGGVSPLTSAWVFAQGGGGFAGGTLFGSYQGYSVVGDWTLEPISGEAEPAGIPCFFATWQCLGGTPKGAAAHELGHTFGLHHPPPQLAAGSLMGWHGDYPDPGLLPHEIMILRQSPFFSGRKAFDRDAPWLNFENQDEARWGERLTLTGGSFNGGGFREGDTVEFRDAAHSVRVRATVESPHELQVTVPSGLAPGYVRIWRGSLRGNAVPVNFAP